jgi:predicted nucleotide-binding protein
VLIARDNVLFESGMFFSQLGRKRTFLAAPSPEPARPFHLPSDLDGLTLVRYSVLSDRADLPAKLGAACTKDL